MFSDSLFEAVTRIISLDKELFAIAWTSVSIAFISVIFASLISMVIAFLLDNASPSFYRFSKSILSGFMAVPTVVIGLIVYGFISRSGVFGKFGLLYTSWGIVIGQVILIIPVITSFILSGISGADRRMSETLKTLGATGFSYFITYLSEIRIILVSSILAGFGRVLGEVGISMMLGGNIRYYTRTMTTAIALETSKGDFAASLSLGLILVTIALTLNIIIHTISGNDKREFL